MGECDLVSSHYASIWKVLTLGLHHLFSRLHYIYSQGSPGPLPDAPQSLRIWFAHRQHTYHSFYIIFHIYRQREWEQEHCVRPSVAYDPKCVRFGEQLP